MESPTMARQSDQVALLCDSSVDPGAARSAGRQRHFVSLASLTVLVTCVLALITLILYGREHLGMSERETVRTIDPPEKYEYDMLLAVDTAKAEAQNDDSLGTSDELQGLLESVGEDPTDPDAVAFLLPLRGHVGGLGMRDAQVLVSADWADASSL
ncbi:hypothetical protein E2C01_019792 [Portunus trituberculatus]|uniref:Uncharacterized protein n=1 Tax=Portunus trituberculatus TaxID=210409 RepID=A0A5B7E0D1_PORTR|nr:hypothetical protein [Portunus trituberculatus]